MLIHTHTHTHRERERKDQEELERVHKSNFENSKSQISPR